MHAYEFGQKMAAGPDLDAMYAQLPTSQVAAPPREDGSYVTYQDLAPSQPKPAGNPYTGAGQAADQLGDYTGLGRLLQLPGAVRNAQNKYLDSVLQANPSARVATPPAEPQTLAQKYLPGVSFNAADYAPKKLYDGLNYNLNKDLLREVAGWGHWSDKVFGTNTGMHPSQIQDVDVQNFANNVRKSPAATVGRELGRIADDATDGNVGLGGALSNSVTRAGEAVFGKKEQPAPTTSAAAPTDLVSALKNTNPWLLGGAGAGLGALGLYGVYSMLRNRRNRQKKQYSRARYPQIIN